METRKVVTILIAGLNEIVSNLEELVSEEGGGKGPKDKEETGSRSSRSSRAKDKDKDEVDDDDNDDDDGEATEDDIVKATRAALKVLDKEDVVKIIKKHGKKEKASEVAANLRQKVIDALEEAVENAD